MATHSTNRKHILLLPLPAYGHVIPLLELGKKIVKHHCVTFAVSQCLFDQIQHRQLVAPTDFSLVCIPDGWTDPLNAQNFVDEANAERMMNAVFAGVTKLLQAIPTNEKSCMKPVGDALGITSPVDVVIGDNFLAGPLATCHHRQIPFYFFNTAAASLTLLGLYVDDDYPVSSPSAEDSGKFFALPVPDEPLPPMPRSLKDSFLPMRQSTSFISGVIFNSVREIEQETLLRIQSFPMMKCIALRFVGPLIPSGTEISVSHLEHQEKVKKWLDTKEATSVVYVSFGSIAFPAPEQTAEIAKALLKLGQPFIWSLPSSQHQCLPAEIKDEIGEQFDAVDGRFLVLPWAPQRVILQHPTTAVFLSHCGWNSTLETVSSGVPVVAWPMMDDQKMDAEWLESHSMAITIKGTGLHSKRLVPAVEISDAIRLVGFNGAVDEEGGIEENLYRKAAKAWSEVLGRAAGLGGSSELDFLELMKSV